MHSSFSDLEYAPKKKQTRLDRFLAEIEAVTLWPALEPETDPLYPKGEGRERPPIGLAQMPRMYVAPQRVALSDEGIKDAICDSEAIRGLVGIELAGDAAPDATTFFSCSVETQGLSSKIFEVIKAYLAEKGLMMHEGTIVDATLLSAPPSPSSRAKIRDPEIHRTKLGNHRYFGMKAHIGVDAESGLVHAVVATTTNTSDVSQTHKLLRGEETEVLDGASYHGVKKHEDIRDTKVSRHLAMKRGKRSAPPANRQGKLLGKLKRASVPRSSIRSTGEKPLQIQEEPLSRAAEELRAAVYAIRPGQSVLGASTFVRASRPRCVLMDHQAARRGERLLGKLAKGENATPLENAWSLRVRNRTRPG